jgi:hypothetical protein
MFFNSIYSIDPIINSYQDSMLTMNANYMVTYKYFLL